MNKTIGKCPNKHVFYFLLAKVAGGPGVTAAVLCRGPFCQEGWRGVLCGNTGPRRRPFLRSMPSRGLAAMHWEGPQETGTPALQTRILSLLSSLQM